MEMGKKRDKNIRKWVWEVGGLMKEMKKDSTGEDGGEGWEHEGRGRKCLAADSYKA